MQMTHFQSSSCTVSEIFSGFVELLLLRFILFSDTKKKLIYVAVNAILPYRITSSFASRKKENQNGNDLRVQHDIVYFNVHLVLRR